jgi:hypothetical protein
MGDRPAHVRAAYLVVGCHPLTMSGVYAVLLQGSVEHVQRVECQLVPLVRGKSKAEPDLVTIDAKPDTQASMVAARKTCYDMLRSQLTGRAITVNALSGVGLSGARRRLGWGLELFACGIACYPLLVGLAAAKGPGEPFFLRVPPPEWCLASLAVFAAGLTVSIVWRPLGMLPRRQAAASRLEDSELTPRVRYSMNPGFPNPLGGRPLAVHGSSAGAAFMAALAEQLAECGIADVAPWQSALRDPARTWAFCASNAATAGDLEKLGAVAVAKLTAIRTYNAERPGARITHAVFHWDDFATLGLDPGKGARPSRLGPGCQQVVSGTLRVVFCKSWDDMTQYLTGPTRPPRFHAWALASLCVALLACVAASPAAPLLTLLCRDSPIIHGDSGMRVYASPGRVAACELAIDSRYWGPVQITLDTHALAPADVKTVLARAGGELVSTMPIPTRERSIGIQFTPRESTGEVSSYLEVCNRARRCGTLALTFAASPADGRGPVPRR